LTQEQLCKLLLPLAGLEKPQVRAMAREAGLTLSRDRLSADQPDSQDICFIDDDYVPFIRDYVKKRPEWQESLVRMDQSGSVIGLDGRNVGTHEGLIHYTPGQRRGFANRTIDRLYVLRSEPQRNELIVGSKEQVCVDRFIVEDLVFSGHESVDSAIRLDCRIRNTATAVAGKVSPLEGDRYLVVLEKAVHAPASGQSAVFYDQDIIAFGGIISGMCSVEPLSSENR
jgi:tRNA-specific 2-thiouridylase